MRVIVTRPEPECGHWVRMLNQAGLLAVALPLIRIGPALDDAAVRQCWQHLDQYQAVMFVSGAAVTHFFARRGPQGPGLQDAVLRTTRFWAPGPGTVAALVREGVDPAGIDAPDSGSGQFDSDALWRVVGGRDHRGQSVLIVRGAEAGAGDPGDGQEAVQGSGRDWLARVLEKAGARVQFVVAYERSAPLWSAADVVLARAAAQDGSVWLFTSSQALAHLKACLPDQSWDRARALATHPRIAQAARAAGFGVVWESRPRVDDVVASIESAG